GSSLPTWDPCASRAIWNRSPWPWRRSPTKAAADPRSPIASNASVGGNEHEAESWAAEDGHWEVEVSPRHMAQPCVRPEGPQRLSVARYFRAECVWPTRAGRGGG